MGKWLGIAGACLIGAATFFGGKAEAKPVGKPVKKPSLEQRIDTVERPSFKLRDPVLDKKVEVPKVEVPKVEVPKVEVPFDQLPVIEPKLEIPDLILKPKTSEYEHLYTDIPIGLAYIGVGHVFALFMHEYMGHQFWAEILGMKNPRASIFWDPETHEHMPFGGHCRYEYPDGGATEMEKFIISSAGIVTTRITSELIARINDAPGLNARVRQFNAGLYLATRIDMPRYFLSSGSRYFRGKHLGDNGNDDVHSMIEYAGLTGKNEKRAAHAALMVAAVLDLTFDHREIIRNGFYLVNHPVPDYFKARGPLDGLLSIDVGPSHIGLDLRYDF